MSEIRTPLGLLHEENKVIYPPPFVTDGTSGPDWILRLENKGFCMNDSTKYVLRSSDFKPNKPGTVIKAVILCDTIFEDKNRITENIWVYAKAFRLPDKRRLVHPVPELACLICEKFIDEETETIDLRYIVAMHKPIRDFSYLPRFLSAGRVRDGRRMLHTYDGDPYCLWNRGSGFAFEVSQE